MKRVTRFDTIVVMVAAYNTTTKGKRRYANIKQTVLESFHRYRKPDADMVRELKERTNVLMYQFLRDFPEE